MAGEDESLETRPEIEGSAGRMLMGIDAEGHKRYLRCDVDGFLLVKAVSIEEEEIQD